MRNPTIRLRDPRRSASGVTAGLAFLFCLQVVAASAAGAQQEPLVPELPPLPPRELPSVVARVNGEEVSRQELLAQAETMRIQAIQAGAGDPGNSEQFLSMVLDALISERLVVDDTQTRGTGPSEAEIEERVKAVVEAYGGDEGFDKALKAQGLDRQYVRRQVTHTLSFDQMMNNEIKPTIEIGEDAIAAYYESNKDNMKVPMLYKLRRILKQVPKEAGAEAEQAARSQLEALRQQAIGGADFAALAKAHSDDEGTREQGGEIPWFPLTGKGGSFETLIAGLEVGQVSEVVETDIGMFLLRLEDRRPERLQTLEEAREQIVNVLSAAEARRVIQGRVQRLRADAKVEVLM